MYGPLILKTVEIPQNGEGSNLTGHILQAVIYVKMALKFTSTDQKTSPICAIQIRNSSVITALPQYNEFPVIQLSIQKF